MGPRSVSRRRSLASGLFLGGGATAAPAPGSVGRFPAWAGRAPGGLSPRCKVLENTDCRGSRTQTTFPAPRSQAPRRLCFQGSPGSQAFSSRTGHQPHLPRVHLVYLLQNSAEHEKVCTGQNCFSVVLQSRERKFKKLGLVRDLNPGPLAPKARIIPLDQRAIGNTKRRCFL